MGELGFWLMVGMIVAAMIVADALKEREKQATLRALLEKEGKSATEVLAYMRERDAAKDAQAARERATQSRQWRKLGRKLAAVVTGIVAFGAGIYAFGAVRFGLLNGSGAVFIPLAPMFGLWTAGLIIAIRMWRSANQKNDAPPVA
ncbi:MAG TPA: hypothetical protein PKE27_17175 [Povalibacter sp.]|uniref:hypothetical protein n=1 Tax=Povalibacter sp. TaxID=1962978 RepID=UPI002D16A51F|nr:hypothetical protein [Povalibacter sp.]HMN46313.1 hypothetical protein [Povalibacter sp.]